MKISETWTIAGAEGLPIHGNTHTPSGGARGVALQVHGWTGCKDRNITPVMAGHLASIGLIVHRFTLSHAGVEKDADRVTRLDEFERDSLSFCVHDIRAVMESKAAGDLPVVLAGHSRAGATIIRVAALARREGWGVRPSALISLAGTAAYTRMDEAMRRELEARGFVERACARAPGGVVRMGRSWYAQHLDHPGRDLFAEDAASIASPLLIVHGDADDAVGVEHAHRVRELVSAGPGTGVDVAVIEAGDHNFNVSGFGGAIEGLGNPAVEAACAAVTAFLERRLG